MHYKLWIATVLGAFLVLFALQNMSPVEITILFWTFESRRIVVIGLCFSIGYTLGWIVKSLQRRKRRANETTCDHSAETV